MHAIVCNGFEGIEAVARALSKLPRQARIPLRVGLDARE